MNELQMLYKLSELEDQNTQLIRMCNYLIQSVDELKAKIDSIESKLNSSEKEEQV